jgi:peptidoglycan/LPS O-acetylase OafA/YrhL
MPQETGPGIGQTSTPGSSPTAPATRAADIPALDGLRAYAVCSVVTGHFFPIPWLQSLVGWGDTGVFIFFCLSGFLITRILLQGTDRAHSRQKGALIKSFYARRFLRIFPAYYLVLAVGVALHYPPIADNLLRLATYSVGILGLPPMSPLRSASHLWSLSIEEQFYLVWPALMIFGPRGARLPLTLTAILASLAYKLVVATHGGSYSDLFRTTLGCVDSLGCGSLAAILYQGPPSPFRQRIASWQIATGAFVVVAALWAYRMVNFDHRYSDHLTFGVIQVFAFAIFFSLLILFLAEHRANPLSAVLSVPPLRFIAKISYGLYLYHYFMPIVINLFVLKLGVPFPHYTQKNVALAAIPLAFAVATLSWHLLERPLLAQKRFYPYPVAVDRD